MKFTLQTAPNGTLHMRTVEKEEILFKKHYKSLCHFAWQMLRDQQAAEDVVQDAFIRYFDKQEHVVDNEAAIKQFLYTCVKFACYNILRREKVDAKYKLSLTPEDFYDDLDIEYKITRAEVMAEVYRIAETMPESCRKIFKMGYLEGLSVKEIADELQISVSTVKTQKKRALNVILRTLKPELFAFFCVLLKNL